MYVFIYLVKFGKLCGGLLENSCAIDLKGGFGSPGELKMTDRIHDINQG